MNYPIFFINNDNMSRKDKKINKNNYWLKYVINQAKYFNPDSQVILIANRNINIFNKIHYYPLKDYCNLANKFRNIYIHLSSNAYNYEIFCIERWFILNEFLIKNNVKSPFFYFDSDVLLLSCINNIIKKFSLISYDYSITGHGGPQYFKSQEILNNYCNLISSFYSNNNQIMHMKEFYKKLRKQGTKGGVGDMYFLKEFLKMQTNYIDLYENTNNKNQVFDENIKNTENYNKYKIFKIKKVYLSQRKAYFYNIKIKKYIRTYGLHFQGNSKVFIPYFYLRTYGIFK